MNNDNLSSINETYFDSYEDLEVSTIAKYNVMCINVHNSTELNIINIWYKALRI